MAEETTYVVLKEFSIRELLEMARSDTSSLGEDDKVWLQLAEGIPAARNTDAILEATKDLDAAGKRGNYAAPSTRNFAVIPRDVRTEEIDEFGTPSTTGTRPRKPQE